MAITTSSTAPMDTSSLLFGGFNSAPYCQDDITFYDDVTPFIKKEKGDDVSLASVLMTTTPVQDVKPSVLFGAVQQQPPTLRDDEIEKAKSEVDSISEQLGIPQDPFLWTPDQVQRWAAWSLTEYCLNKSLAEDFRGLDGTSLCLLSEDDFRRRSPYGGEALHTQLEFWRNAYNAYNSPADSYVDPPTYTDLSTASMSSLPTPVVISTAAATTTHTMNQPHTINGCFTISSMAPVTSTSSSSIRPCMNNAASNVAISIPRPTNFASCSVPSRLSPAPSLDSCDSPASFSSSSDDFEMRSVKKERGMTPTKQNIHLWQFLRELLMEPRCYGNSIRWLDRPKGIFKIEDSARVARLWGQRKNRPAMNYDKLSRSIRQYYKKGIIKKTDNSKRLVYQFCPNYRI